MTKLRKLAGFALLALAGAGLAGCAATRKTRSVETTGFLGDYSLLKEGDRDQAQLVYIKPSLNLAGYTKIMIDPITVMRPADSNLANLPPEDVQRMTDSLYGALDSELRQDYELTRRPGPGTLRVRAAITEARGSKVAMNVVTSVVPQLKMATTLGGLATDTDVFVGKAAVEAEIVDSLTGERLMAAVDERVGTKKIIGAARKWKDVEDAHKFWASKLRMRLAELSGRNPEGGAAK